LIGSLVGWLIGRLVHWWVDRFIGWLGDRLVGWFIDWLVDRLVGCFASLISYLGKTYFFLFIFNLINHEQLTQNAIR